MNTSQYRGPLKNMPVIVCILASYAPKSEWWWGAVAWTWRSICCAQSKKCAIACSSLPLYAAVWGRSGVTPHRFHNPNWPAFFGNG